MIHLSIGRRWWTVPLFKKNYIRVRLKSDNAWLGFRTGMYSGGRWSSVSILKVEVGIGHGLPPKWPTASRPA